MQNQKNSGSSIIWPDFACGSTIRGPIDKWSSQADSALKTGLDSMFQEVLTVVESGHWGDNKNTRDLQKSVPTLLVAQHPEALWPNGVDRWIQREKLV